MQTTIYYKEDDSYLIDKVEKKSNTERKSKSAVILSILENYFEAEKRIGEILKDLGVLKREHLREALENQKDGKKDKLLGEIMLEEGCVEEIDLDRALQIQSG